MQLVSLTPNPVAGLPAPQTHGAGFPVDSVIESPANPILNDMGIATECGIQLLSDELHGVTLSAKTPAEVRLAFIAMYCPAGENGSTSEIETFVQAASGPILFQTVEQTVHAG